MLKSIIMKCTFKDELQNSQEQFYMIVKEIGCSEYFWERGGVYQLVSVTGHVNSPPDTAVVGGYLQLAR